MYHPSIRAVLAGRYHNNLPADMRRYLNGRGIPDAMVNEKLLGWTGSRITIPVFGLDSTIVQFRYAKSPRDRSDSPKVTTEFGCGAELYGWERLAKRPRRIVICEGEFDRLVLEARGFEAVTSTAGAQTFKPEWALSFVGVKHIFICFDRDEAGESAAARLKTILPSAKIVRLPAVVGDKGDVTDYFVRLGHDRVDFEILLANAAAAEEPADTRKVATLSRGKPPPSVRPHPRADRLKRAIRLVQLVGRYTDLRNAGGKFVGRCPFHDDDRPSFTIYPETNTYNCFGCGAHGDLIAFVMHKESKTFHEALDFLERFEHTDEL